MAPKSSGMYNHPSIGAATTFLGILTYSTKRCLGGLEIRLHKRGKEWGKILGKPLAGTVHGVVLSSPGLDNGAN